MHYELFNHSDQNKRIYLVDMTKEKDFYVSETVHNSIQKAIDSERRVLIVGSNTGYDKGLFCKTCGTIPQCEDCSVSLSFYKINENEKIGLCHVCKRQYFYPDSCSHCNSKDLFAYGLGLQKLQEYLATEFDVDSFQITAKIANSTNKIKTISENISKYKFFVGTNILIQKPFTINFDLIIIMNSDLGLYSPDFDAMRATFYNLYRFFTKHPTVNYIVQTRNYENPVIRKACAMDQVGFTAFDDEFRQSNLYPPFVDMAIIIYRHKIESSLYNNISKLYQELLFLREKYNFQNDIEIFQTPAIVYKMFSKYRYHIILKGKNVRHFLDIVVSKLGVIDRGFKIDWDTSSLSIR